MTDKEVFLESQRPYKEKYGRWEWLLAPFDWHWSDYAELQANVACGWAMYAGMLKYQIEKCNDPRVLGVHCEDWDRDYAGDIYYDAGGR